MQFGLEHGQNYAKYAHLLHHSAATTSVHSPISRLERVATSWRLVHGRTEGFSHITLSPVSTAAASALTVVVNVRAHNTLDVFISASQADHFLDHLWDRLDLPVGVFLWHSLPHPPAIAALLGLV